MFQQFRSLSKSLTRRQNQVSTSGDSVSYSLLDATKGQAFLNYFVKSGFQYLDKVLLAYKPRKGKFVAFVDQMTTEEVERFINSVLIDIPTSRRFDKSLFSSETGTNLERFLIMALLLH